VTWLWLLAIPPWIFFWTFVARRLTLWLLDWQSDLAFPVYMATVMPLAAVGLAGLPVFVALAFRLPR
jgi:hypothetical protein